MQYMTRNAMTRLVDDWTAPAGCHRALEVLKCRKSAAQWFVVVYVEGPGLSRTLGNAVYHDGWNNSFHAAHYAPAHVCAWGKSPGAARRAAMAAIATLAGESRKDSCTVRAERRAMVREGD